MGFARPAQTLAFGYLVYILLGTALLMLPISQVKEVSFLDHLFISASAVSTTGLATVDPGSSYTGFGQLVILILIQLGGLGYMTVSSFVILAANKKLSSSRLAVLKGAFALPKTIGVARLVRDMFVFAFVCEILGAALLYPLLKTSGVENALWSAIFHSISAFCTAGFSLFSNSFEGYRANPAVNLILAALSYAGGLGFIVYSDLAARLRSPHRQLTFTTQVILGVTSLFAVFGTLAIFVLEPKLQDLAFGERLLGAFFQTMTASTTVGFNTLPIGSLSLPTIMVLYFLMFFGASPAGTGGGLKITTLTALLAEGWSHLRGYRSVCMMGRQIPESRVRAASMSATAYGLVLGLGIFSLSLAMPTANFEWMVFEAISAMGTVGLSMGLTAELTTAGKWVVIALMYVGRVGVVTLGLSFVAPALFEKARGDDLAV